jgi:hypothetical protein
LSAVTRAALLRLTNLNTTKMRCRNRGALFTAYV